MGAPDPDIFYATEGLEVMTSVYQGLLQYANNSTKVVGDLAKSWTISDGGLTYTFNLRSGVKFHDGSPFNSAAVAFSFQRRTGINQAPAYMMAHVRSVATPTPTELVVHLGQPVSAFLDYLASPFGPKMVSPTAVKAHEVGISKKAPNGDCAPTMVVGPRCRHRPLWDFELGHQPALRPHPLQGLPGPAPFFSSVRISIVPSISTQQLELRSGQLDMVLHGLTPQAVKSFATDKQFAVHQYPTEMKGILFVNPHRGPFVSQAARDALEEDLDKQAITAAVYGPAGTPSTEIFPSGELPASVQSSVVPYRPSALAKLANSLVTKAVDVGYDPTDPRNQDLAEFVQIALDHAGLTATTRPIPIAQIFGLAADPAAAPDILIQTTNPDAAHPDTWSRIYMSKTGGANYLQCYSTVADNLMNAGLAATSTATVNADYGKAGDLLVKQGCFIDIADVQDQVVSRAGLIGFYHVPSIPWALNLGTLANG